MKRRPLFLTLAVLTLIATTAIAWARFTSTASGSGTGNVASVAPVTATAATITDTLYPDGTAHDVTLTVKNPNSFAVRVVSVTQNGDITGSGGFGSCSNTGITFTPGTVNVSIPPGNIATPATLSGAAKLTSASDAGCQSATFMIPVTLGVKTP
jgi:hypothetical protein